MGGGPYHEGLPHPNPTTSYWQVPPHPLANERTTKDLPRIAGYVIVGSGITGAGIAYKLLSAMPSTSVLMLEARTACTAASGRNGGHCRPGWWLDFKNHAEAYGEKEALLFEALEEETVQDVSAFVKEHGIDCDFQDVETVDAYRSKTEFEEALETARFRDAVAKRHPKGKVFTERRVWHGKEAEERLGMVDLEGAFTYPAHTVSPYKLTCGILDMALKKGLNLQTGTPVLHVSRDGNTSTESKEDGYPWSVETERGTVRAKNVILATNGYTEALYPALAQAKFLTPSRNQIAAVRPSAKMSGNPALRRSTGLIDSAHNVDDYMMSRAPGLSGEGDILYGGGRQMSKNREMGILDDSTLHEGISTYLRQAAPALFGRENWGEDEDGKVVREWTGIIGYTADHFPMVGEAKGEKGLWICAGFNGHGKLTHDNEAS